MTHRIWKTFIAFACVLAVVSCTTTENPFSAYSYSATVWRTVSENQLLLTASGTTNHKGGHIGHYLGEPVSIVLPPIPEDSVVIGSLTISSSRVEKCLPIRKWSKGGKTIYAICDPHGSDKQAAVFIETDSKVLTDPLLGELISTFIPNKPDAGDGE